MGKTGEWVKANHNASNSNMSYARKVSHLKWNFSLTQTLKVSVSMKSSHCSHRIHARRSAEVCFAVVKPLASVVLKDRRAGDKQYLRRRCLWLQQCLGQQWPVPGKSPASPAVIQHWPRWHAHDEILRHFWSMQKIYLLLQRRKSIKSLEQQCTSFKNCVGKNYIDRQHYITALCMTVCVGHSI